MNIAVLGTGGVGVAIGNKLIELGHHVAMGSRTADNAKAVEWAKAAGPSASAVVFADAIKFGEIVFNCTLGVGSIDALGSAGAAALKGKLVIDISNPLDFSKGMPPSLFVGNTDSLGEQIQRAFPDAHIVKTLNTVAAPVMVDPSIIPGDHDMFVCANDARAKAQAIDILKNWFGWKSVVDLGDLTGARATEAWVPFWVRIMMTTGSPMHNIKVVR